jgi:hypothetical protein
MNPKRPNALLPQGFSATTIRVCSMQWCHQIIRFAPAAWLVLLVLAGCSSPRVSGPINLAEPGWQVERGQGIWQPRRQASELAGDLLLARNADGATMVQFVKTPFPTVTARTAGSWWRIEYQPQNRRFAGRGHPPKRCLFLYVSAALAGRDLPADITFQKLGDGQWRLRNEKTGEVVEGGFTP